MSNEPTKTRDEVKSLLVRARWDCSVVHALAVLRSAVRERQPDFVYDVLAYLEEAEDVGYDRMRDLLRAAIQICDGAT